MNANNANDYNGKGEVKEILHNSENEIDVSLPATPARISDLGSLESNQSTQSNQGSFVWSHFTKDVNFKDNKKAICNYCNKKYTCFGSSTSNLAKHLRNVHSIQPGSQSQPNRPSVLEMLAGEPKVFYVIYYYFFFWFL